MNCEQSLIQFLHGNVRKRQQLIGRSQQSGYKNCLASMRVAAEAGEYYCEVKIDREFYEDLASFLAEFQPSINGDGYTETVICLRWHKT